tara:strand:- start:4933 stop:5694 length:762 start_codon:yes stop_codon:yes gene_type:complete
MKTLAVIPARWTSKRFPGKPIANIMGLPMIVHVYNRTKGSKEITDVIIATDDKRIANVCKQHSLNYIMTSKKCKTGTDRVAEVAKKIQATFYINIQGDSPLVNKQDIDKMVKAHKIFIKKGISVTNSYVLENKTNFKRSLKNLSPHAYLIQKKDGTILSISRHTIPYIFTGEGKNVISYKYKSHVGMYVFTRNSLLKYTKLKQGEIEKSEGIEMLRFIENGIKIGCVQIKGGDQTVDHKEDIIKVEKMMRKKV